MNIKKFITTVTESLGLEIMESTKKKKSIKSLLKKLNKRKIEIKKSLEGDMNKKTKKELEEEYEIICFQIKKGDKILLKLTTNK